MRWKPIKSESYMRKPNLGTRDPITRFNGKNVSYDDLLWNALIFINSIPMMWVNLSYNDLWRLSLWTLNESTYLVWVGCQIIGAPLTDFTYVSVKVGRFLWEWGLFSKTLMKSGIAQGRNVLAKKTYVNTLIVVCKQWYFISLKQS